MADFNQSSMRELKINDGNFHLYLSKNQSSLKTPVSVKAASAIENSSSTHVKDDEQVTAPLVGTVYLQAKPNQAPYVHVGSHVKVGDVVCVIEAMKMMTEIKAKTAGVVKKVNVENGELVEVDQPLMTLTKE